MSKIKILWHEPSNSLAIADSHNGGLPLLTILDDEFTGINPFYAYPLVFLEHFGWHDLGLLAPKESVE